MILYSDQSSLEKTEKIDNYYGFENGVSGKELYAAGIKQAENIGVETKKQEVLNIAIEENGFKIITDKEEYFSKTVILSTGSKKNKPRIKGIEEFEGKGISYCAICDGFFYKNKNIVVIGNGKYAIAETNELINIANHITILTNGKEAPEFRAENVTVDTKEIEEIRGEKKVEEIQFKNQDSIKVDGIFVAQGVAGSIEFAKKLGIITKKDKIAVNENMETNIKGIYACGDCTGGLLQVAKAVHEGAIAGLQAINYIRNSQLGDSPQIGNSKKEGV